MIANNDNGNEIQPNNSGIGYGRPPKGRPFPKGKSGNRNGRPKGTSLTAIIRRVLAEPDSEHGTKADALIVMAEKRARKGDFRFFKELIDRNDGKVADQLSVKGQVEHTHTIKQAMARVMDDPEACEAAKLLADRLSAIDGN